MKLVFEAVVISYTRKNSACVSNITQT